MAIRYLDEEVKKSGIIYEDEVSPSVWASIFPRASSKNPLDTKGRLESGIIDALSLPGRALASVPALAPGGESFLSALGRTSGKDANNQGFSDLPSRAAGMGGKLLGDVVRDPATIPTLGVGLGLSALKLGNPLARATIIGGSEGLTSAGVHGVAADAAGEPRTAGSLALEAASGPVFRGAGSIVKGVGSGLRSVGKGISDVNVFKGLKPGEVNIAPVIDKNGFQFTPASVAGHNDPRNAFESLIQNNAVLGKIPGEIKAGNVEATKSALLKQRGKFANAPSSIGDEDFTSGGERLRKSFQDAKTSVGKAFQSGEEETFDAIRGVEMPRTIIEKGVTSKTSYNDLKNMAKNESAGLKQQEAEEGALYYLKNSNPREAIELIGPDRFFQGMKNPSEAAKQRRVASFFGLNPNEAAAMDKDFHVPGRLSLDAYKEEFAKDYGQYTGNMVHSDNEIANMGMNAVEKKRLGQVFRMKDAVEEMRGKDSGLYDIEAGPNEIQKEILGFLESKGYNPKAGITGNESIGENAIKYLDQLQGRLGNAYTMEDLLNQRRNFADKIKSRVWDNNQMFTGRDEAALNDAYFRLNGKIGDTFETTFPGAEGKTLRAAWEANNSRFSSTDENLNDIGNRVGFSQNNVETDKYFNKIKNIGAEKITELVIASKSNSELRPLVDNLRAGFFDSILKNSLMKQSESGVTLSPNRLLTNWRSIDPGIKEAYLGKDVVSNIDDVMNSVAKLKMTDAEFLNPSQSANQAAKMWSAKPKNWLLSQLMKGPVTDYYKTGNVGPAETVLSLIGATGDAVNVIGSGASKIGKSLPYAGYAYRKDNDTKINPSIRNLNR